MKRETEENINFSVLDRKSIRIQPSTIAVYIPHSAFDCTVRIELVTTTTKMMMNIGHKQLHGRRDDYTMRSAQQREIYRKIADKQKQLTFSLITILIAIELQRPTNPIFNLSKPKCTKSLQSAIDIPNTHTEPLAFEPFDHLMCTL